MKKGVLIFSVASSLILSLTVFSAPVKAQGGKIHVGNLKVVPGLALEEEYDDNIYLGNGTNTTDEIEESDWITHIKPSLQFIYSLNKRGSVSLGYEGDFAYYGETDANDWKTHKVPFKLDYEAPGGLILGIDNTYTDAEDPYGSSNEFGLGEPKTERWTNDLKTKTGFVFSDKFKIMGYYNFYKQDYDLDDDYAQDYYYNEFGVGGEMKVLPKTWGFIRYHFGEKEYFTHPAGTGSNENNDSDYDWHRVNAGLSWDSGAKIGGELNFGYQWEDYDNTTDSNGDRYEDKDTWIASTSLNYDATSTTKLSLSLSRGFEESASNTNEYYESTSIGTTLKQTIRTKYTLSAGLTYSLSDYNLPLNAPREDDGYNFTFDFDYKIQKWLSAGVGYTYDRKDSNYIENDYTDNKILFSVKMAY